MNRRESWNDKSRWDFQRRDDNKRKLEEDQEPVLWSDKERNKEGLFKTRGFWIIRADIILKTERDKTWRT